MLAYPLYKELNNWSDLDASPLWKSLTRDYSSLQVPVDIIESEENFVLRLAIPGVKQDQIDIQLEKDQLNVVVKQQQNDDVKGKYLKNQILKADVEKSFRVPEHIDRDRVEASVEDGILTIVLHKSEAVQPRKIQIKAS